jgi:ketosteroid isomerase-like protein
MTEQTNRAVVEQIYAAFRRRDLPGVLALQTEDAEWSVAASRAFIPWAGPSEGHAGVTAFLRTLADWLIADVFEIREYVVSGDTVIALGFQQGTVKPTGAPYSFDFVHVWSLSGGRVRRFRVYYDTAYLGAVLANDMAKPR